MSEAELLARVDALLMEASDILASRPVKGQPYTCVRLGREVHEMRRNVQRRLGKPVTVLGYIYPALPYDRCPLCGEDRGHPSQRAEHRCGT